MDHEQDEKIARLRQAIAVLAEQRAILGEAVVAEAVAALEKQIAELQADDSADQQRKIATVLFTDIVGSTSLIQKLDPEDNLAIMRDALTGMTAAVTINGGHVVRYQGDGFKAVFGLPQAAENDPINAVRAGLGILAAARDFGQRLQRERQLDGFAVRVGIDTGLVIAGGGIEAGDSVTGLTVNLAARLESAAAPGELLISHRTYQHLHDTFLVAARLPIQAKGFPEPVPVYQVKGEKPRAFESHQRGVAGIATRTIGREDELGVLQRAFLTAAGRCQSTLVTVVGEAGQGKSRLIDEFSHWLAQRPETVWRFRGRAGPQAQGRPQLMLRYLFADHFQIRDGDDLAVVRGKFVAGVGRYLQDQAEMKAHILGAWLGYDFGDSAHLQTMADDPKQIKDRAVLYLTQLFAAAGAQQPVLLLLDDLQWADQPSLEALIDLLRHRPDLPMLAICLARPALYRHWPDWPGRLPAAVRLDLAPLSAAATQDLVREILRRVELVPNDLVAMISDRAEGNPFYAEELVNMLIDDGVILVGPRAWQIRPEKLVALRVPATLTGVLQARLDRLKPEERETIYQAAVVGRVFWHGALAALGHEQPAGLATLQDREFIFARSESAFAGTDEYIFKHALLRDATYEMVLKQVRRQYHALVAEWLVAAAAANGRSDEYAALIAEHFQAAEQLEAAATWYGRAGRQAKATFAHEEALRFFDLALTFTPQADSAARFALHGERWGIHAAQGKRAAQLKDTEAMAALAESLDERARVEALLRQNLYFNAVSDVAQAGRYAEMVIARSEAAGFDDLMAAGYDRLGQVVLRQGQFAEAQTYLQKGLQLAEKLHDRRRMASILHTLARAAIDLGDFGTAQEKLVAALALYREVGSLSGEGYVLISLGILAEEQLDYVTAIQQYEQVVAIGREIGERSLEVHSLQNLGFCAWNQGDVAAARRYYEKGLQISRETGSPLAEGNSLLCLGNLAARAGDDQTATANYQAALANFRAAGDRNFLGFCLHELGALALRQMDLAAAERYLTESQALRQEMQLPHCLVEDWAGLARLHLAAGDRAQAQQFADKILAYLPQNPYLKGAENRMRTFRNSWEVLTQLDLAAAADEVLARAAALIEAYLEKNEGPGLRAMYLGQPDHAAIWAALSARKANPGAASRPDANRHET